MTAVEIWRGKSDDEVSAAMAAIDEYTEVGQQIIRDEVARRGLTREAHKKHDEAMDAENAQNPENPAKADAQRAEKAPKSVPPAAGTLVGAAVISGLVPAALLGNVAAKAIAESFGQGGPVVAIVLVGLTGIVLAALGAGAFGLATKWPKGGAVVGGAGVMGLAGLSLLLLSAVEEAREGLMVFGITVVVLALMAGFVKLSGGK